MKINRFLFQNKDYVLESEIDFSREEFDPSHIKRIEGVHVRVKGRDYEDFLVLDISIKAKVIGVCSYTLEDVPLDISLNESLTFSYEEEDEDVIHIDKPIFDLDPYILSLIISEVPLKIIKKGAKLPSSGNGYRVIKEDDYLKENENKKDSRWDKLDDIKL